MRVQIGDLSWTFNRSCLLIPFCCPLCAFAWQGLAPSKWKLSVGLSQVRLSLGVILEGETSCHQKFISFAPCVVNWRTSHFFLHSPKLFGYLSSFLVVSRRYFATTYGSSIGVGRMSLSGKRQSIMEGYISLHYLVNIEGVEHQSLKERQNRAGSFSINQIENH